MKPVGLIPDAGIVQDMQPVAPPSQTPIPGAVPPQQRIPQATTADLGTVRPGATAPAPVLSAEIPALKTIERGPGVKSEFGEKLKTLAKKTGRTVAELLQAGAYGWAGVNKPLAVDTRLGQEREDKKAADAKKEREESKKEERDYDKTVREEDRAADAAVRGEENLRADAIRAQEQEFQMRLAEIKAEYDAEMAAAQTVQDEKDAERKRTEALEMAKTKHGYDMELAKLVPQVAGNILTNPFR